MRIEKINENQIRCTLSQKDLKDRELRISELAYGTEKAKALFRDMMQQASYEFGFEVDDIPLMIEAIPMLPDALVLVITKIEDPEELDTRFSTFTDDPDEDLYDIDNLEEAGFDFADSLTSEEELFYDSDLLEEPETAMDNYETLPFKTENTSEKADDFISLPEALGMEPRPRTETPKDSKDIVRIYQFHSLEQLSSLGEHLLCQYEGQNTIYKDNISKRYILILHKTNHTPEEFNKICNTVSEYGSPVRNTYASSSYYEEHFEPIVKDKALQVLGKI